MERIMADRRKQGQDQRTQLGQHQDKQARKKNPEKQKQRASPLGLEAKDDSGTVVKRNKHPGGTSR